MLLSIAQPAPRAAPATASTTRCCCSACWGWRSSSPRQNLVTLFIGFELLSIPLYVLCAAEFRREGSLESGLKYLVIGSVGSATLVYGLALIYGATGADGLLGDRQRDLAGRRSPVVCWAIRCC